MKINANINALLTARHINKTNDKVAKSLEKLSSGYKINRVSDDPAGTAVSSKIKAQLYGLQLASKNSADGVSLVQSAEGAMIELHDMLSRMRELVVQAANDTNVTGDREKMQVEIDQLIEAIDSMVEVTEFNQMKLINGGLSNLTTVSDAGVLSHDIDVKYMSPNFPLGEYELDLGAMTLIPGDFTIEQVDNRITATNKGGEKIMIDIETETPAGPYTINIEDTGQLKIQTGPNEEQRISLMIPPLSPESLGLRIKEPPFTDGIYKNLISTADATSAQNAIGVLDEAISRVSTMRSTLGAYQNRLEHLVKNLDMNVTNTASSLSRLIDTDMASEMTGYTLNNVILQSGIAMLSQANERPQQLLQLLR